MKKPELLLPAGSLSKLKTALLYGADAVYAGTPEMSLRAKSHFYIEEMEEGIKFAKDAGKKVYLAINLFPHNKDIERLEHYVKTLKILNPNGVIVSDPGIFQYVKKEIPSMPLHISTQANVCSWLTVNFWKNMGASLCVLGREVSFKEACEIRKQCRDIKLEIFVHGAMCISYSGRCLMSAFMASRSANQGVCAHSCRWKYKSRLVMEEELRPGEYLEMEEDEHGSYILNSKDLCLMPKLNEILTAGFDSFKIEGRNKSKYYVAQTARVYRKAIDDYFKKAADWKADFYVKELETLQNRGYTTGFFDGIPSENAQDYNDTSSKSSWRNIGYVKENGGDYLIIDIRNKLKKGDVVELLSPYKFEPEIMTIDKMYDGFANTPSYIIAPGRQNQTAKIPIKSELAHLFPKLTVLRMKI
ncbi:MAG: U32 family peptidase C-terminal domain-containing protein [Endomicrobium sp.]|nr:U32 family peptidase C-terminal domain-containing protein [Endomicrobium sp.]